MIAMVAGALFSAFAGLPNVSATTCEFGEVYQGEPAKCLIEFVNRGDSEVRIHSIEPIVPGDKVDVSELRVPPQATAHVTLVADTSIDAGTSNHPIRLRIPGVETEGAVNSRGYVFNVFDPMPATIDMDIVDLGDAKRRAGTLTVSSPEDPSARLGKVISAPSFLDVNVDSASNTISVKVRDDAPWGPFEQPVVVGVDSTRQKRYGIKVKGNVRGNVVPSSNPLALDLVRRGSGKHDFIITLSDTSKKALKLGKITLDKLEGSVKDEPCVPASDDCRWLRLNISDKQPAGKIDGAVRVELPDYGRTLPIWVWGLMVNATTVIHDANEPAAAAEADAGNKDAAAAAPLASATVKGGNLIDQIKQATAPTKPSEVPGKGPLLRWQVENEMGIYGYAIYRADSAQGPWRRVNDSVVRAESVPESVSSYAWRDTTAETGRKYWYYIGTLGLNGERKRFTSPSEVTAK